MGIAVLICVVMLLLATPASLFSPVTYIDTALDQSSENKVPVRTRTDFGSPEVMASLPYEIGKWDGYDYDTTEYINRLGADLILLRGYLPDRSGEELFLTINQAKTESSIHRPPYCFRSQGYLIQEEGLEKVAIDDTSWIKGSVPVSIPINKLVAAKTSESGQVVDRRLSLYCFVKGNQFYSDTVTFIQTETVAPLEGSFESSVNELKEFWAKAIPLMFSPGQSDTQWRPLAFSLAKQGAIGFAVLSLLILIPIGIILYPRIRGRK